MKVERSEGGRTFIKVKESGMRPNSVPIHSIINVHTYTGTQEICSHIAANQFLHIGLMWLHHCSFSCKSCTLLNNVQHHMALIIYFLHTIACLYNLQLLQY